MSYRNPQQVVDTQTGQHYRNLQNVIAGTFSQVAKSYKEEQNELAKEQKKIEAKNKAIIDNNQRIEDSLMSSVAKLKAKNPTLDTSEIYAMVDRYSDIKNAIDLGTITDKGELRKMREELAQIMAIPDGINSTLVGFGTLTEEYKEATSKAGKLGGLDLKSADSTFLHHLNVFLNKEKGERSFKSQKLENGNIVNGIFIKSNEEGDNGKFYTQDELRDYLDGSKEGLPVIPDDTEDQEGLYGQIIGNDPITKKPTVAKEEFLKESTITLPDGSIEKIKVFDEQKVRAKLGPLAEATVRGWGLNGIVSYYNNILSKGKTDVLTVEDLKDENKIREVANTYLNKFIESKGILNFDSTRRFRVDRSGSTRSNAKKEADTSYIDNLNIPTIQEEPGYFVNEYVPGSDVGNIDMLSLEKELNKQGFNVKQESVVGDAKALRVTKKNLAGKDIDITIRSDMKPEEVRNLIRKAEGVKNTESTETVEKDIFGNEIK